MISCPEYQSEFASSNQVYTPIVSIPSYVMFCNAIVNTVEELNGKRLRYMKFMKYSSKVLWIAPSSHPQNWPTSISMMLSKT